MASFGSVKEGWLTKQGGERKNWKKRWFLLQDNILYYFADQKDEFSKGSIPLGKVTAVQKHEHKKKFIFEVHTSVEGRVFYIMAETEALLKEWMDAVTSMWTLHMMKDKYKEKFYHGADNYLHTIINMSKRIATTTVRMTGVTKAVITGGGRANKAKPAEAATIHADNAELGASVIEVCKQVLVSEKEPYKYDARKSLERAVQNAIRLADLIGGRGAGSVNEGACVSTARQLQTELNNLVTQTYPPSMKTNILYLVQLHAQVMGKFSEASNSDLKIGESKRLEELGKAFPIVAKEVFPHMPDLTYAQPLLDGCNLVPRITYDVRELVKSAAVYTAGETYATNCCKTLFYLLNDIRRQAMAGFPPSPYDDKFPQVGPPDAQFQLSSAEFASNIAGAGEAPTDGANGVDGEVPQMDGLSFDDFSAVPPPPPEEDHPLTISMSSMGSYGSSEAGTDSYDISMGGSGGFPGSPASVGGRPMAIARNPHLQNLSGGGMNIGSAPATLTFNNAMTGYPQASPLSLSGGHDVSMGLQHSASGPLGRPGSTKMPMNIIPNVGAPPPISFGGPSASPQPLANLANGQPRPPSGYNPGMPFSTSGPTAAPNPGVNPQPGSAKLPFANAGSAPPPNPGMNPTPGGVKLPFANAGSAPVPNPGMNPSPGSFKLPPTPATPPPGVPRVGPPTGVVSPPSMPGTPPPTVVNGVYGTPGGGVKTPMAGMGPGSAKIPLPGVKSPSPPPSTPPPTGPVPGQFQPQQQQNFGTPGMSPVVGSPGIPKQPPPQIIGGPPKQQPPSVMGGPPKGQMGVGMSPKQPVPNGMSPKQPMTMGGPPKQPPPGVVGQASQVPLQQGYAPQYPQVQQQQAQNAQQQAYMQQQAQLAAQQQQQLLQQQVYQQQQQEQQQQQLLLQQQQQQLWIQQQQLLQQQQAQQQALLFQQQQEAEAARQAQEAARQAEEAARKAEQDRLAAEQAEKAKQASALDELSKLEWNI